MRALLAVSCSRGLRSSVCAGSVTEKVDPQPWPPLLAEIEPPASRRALLRWPPEAQPGPPASRSGGLTEAFEDQRQKLRRNALPRVLDRQDDVVGVGPGRRGIQANSHHAPGRSEFHGVAEQVPEDLLQARRVAHNHGVAGENVHFQVVAFGIGGRLDRGDGAPRDVGKTNGCGVEVQLPGDDARDVEKMSMASPALAARDGWYAGRVDLVGSRRPPAPMGHPRMAVIGDYAARGRDCEKFVFGAIASCASAYRRALSTASRPRRLRPAPVEQGRRLIRRHASSRRSVSWKLGPAARRRSDRCSETTAKTPAAAKVLARVRDSLALPIVITWPIVASAAAASRACSFRDRLRA